MLSTEQVFIKSENVKVPLNKEVCAALNDICQFVKRRRLILEISAL